MAKPVIGKVTPFDGNKDKTINLGWNGDQSHANRLIIYNADTMEVAYDKKVTSFLLSHVIPAETLINGKNWIAQCQVFDVEDIESELSDKVFFQTFKNPEFYFYNISEGQTINAATYEAIIYYFQEDYEDIQSYKFYLYDEMKSLLLESETLYDSNKINYTFKGLSNHTTYNVRCVGITVNGMEIDTGYISFYTDYKVPSTYGIIYADNDALHGYVKLHTNIKVIQYNGDKTFNFINGMIDLRNNFIYYDEGFVIDGDFALRLIGMNLNQTATILELRNTKRSIILSSYLYDDGIVRFKLTVPNALGNYILYSDPISFGEDDMISIRFKRVNNIYSLVAEIKEDFSFINNWWFGRQMPGGNNLETNDVWIDTDDMFTYVVDKDVMKIYTDENEPENIDVDNLWIGGK